ncbi:MAG: DUF368 domain-containing protein [Candidatus Margulisbacteria bacterium GWF2_35_9]|nr:MAG: DUF368 domain-containing protein [Candidatus Margulisbacteria bacterium GWF2_35_9]
MGAANVIPGVSGGTIALITGIFERLINAIKSFDFEALRLLLQFKFKEFSSKVDLYFLLILFSGAAVGVLSFARIFDYFFTHYPIYIWALFMGLILASVFFVIKTINHWNVSVVISLSIGLIISVSISLMTPMSENDAILYLFLCGVVAICSMILPGLSGSFVLVLMGNYQLIVIDAVNHLNIKILIPVAAGAGFGLLVFSHILAYIYRKFRNQTIAVLSGFIMGSLMILWPWKNEIYKLTSLGGFLLKKNGEKILAGYSWYIPHINNESLIAFGFILAGILIIYFIEKISAKSH